MRSSVPRRPFLRGRQPAGRLAARRLALFFFAVVGLLLIPVAANALTSPRTWVHLPADDSKVIGGDLTVTGAARHNRGVSSVSLVVKNLDDKTYWNGDDWQKGFVRFAASVDRPGAKNVSWSYTVPESDMTDGNYRARAFSRSVEGNGDSRGGDQNEFRYSSGLDPRLYDTEIVVPANGSTINGAVRVEGTARSIEGVAQVRVAIHNNESRRYWDAQNQVWSASYVQSKAVLDEIDGTETGWHVAIPDDQSTVGDYTARAWVQTASGKGDPFGRGRTAFTVIAPVTTTTTPPTTQPPTTVPPTTQPPTTAPPTTRPPTTRPPTTRPPTTQPTTTVAPTTRPPTTQPPSCPDGNVSILVPCEGLLVGASGDFRARDGLLQSKQDHFAAMEDRLNAEFDIFHNFLLWNEMVDKTWPKAKTQALADNGHLLFTNWKSPTGSPTDWAKIANGQFDADILTAAGQVREFGEPTFITFYHEPEDNIRDASGGDQAKIQQYIDDYRDAFRHIVDVFDKNGADNAIWVWDMQGWLGSWESYYTNGLYPGDDVVDWVAWNPYNWFGCVNHGAPTKWKSFEEVVAPFYDWLDKGGSDRPSKDKPLMLGEWGSEENTGATNSDQTKAEWLDEARQILPERFPRLRAIVYFDTEGRRADGTVQFCEWGISSSQDSMSAMARMMNDPNLDPRW